jgi:hypothetical protein
VGLSRRRQNILEKIFAYDERSVFIAILFTTVLLLLVTNITSYEFGAHTAGVEKKQEKNAQESIEKWVNRFLIAYYTKKELGENHTRMRGFMKKSLFESIVKRDELPVHLAYKDVMRDQVLSKTEIYDDRDGLTVLTVTHYHYQLNVVQKDGSMTSKKVEEVEALKLRIIRVGAERKIAGIEKMTIEKKRESSQSVAE